MMKLEGTITITISFRKGKSITKSKEIEIWQDEKGTYLYKIQKSVLVKNISDKNRREEVIMRFRVGHTYLTDSFNWEGK